MRIFCAVRHAADPKKHYGSLWSANFYPALGKLGHEVVESQTDLESASDFLGVETAFTPDQIRIRGEITTRILDELKAAHARQPIDLFLSYFYNSHFDPAAFDDIHRMGITTVNYYCNSIYQFELVAQIAPRVNFSWHAEKHAKPLYEAAGANPVWVQMGADPDVYRPVPGLSRIPKATFVGMRYADRGQWMAALINGRVPVDIHGPGWGETAATSTFPSPAVAPPKRSRVAGYLKEIRRNVDKFGMVGGLARTRQQFKHLRKSRELMPLFAPFARGPVPFTKICEIFSAYEVVLNFSNVWADGRPGSKLIPHVRLRDFEGPMCRTCFLTGYTDEITEFYEIGKEIDAYRTETELVEKTKYYLANPDAAERLRHAGYERALRDHTWVRRFEELFTKIGMKSP